MTLFDFAYMPNRDKANRLGKYISEHKNINTYSPREYKHLRDVKDVASPEEWGENLSYLRDYININFEIAYNQGLVKEAKDHSYAIWRVGNLTTLDGEPISIVVRKNELNVPPYVYHKVYCGEQFKIYFSHHEVVQETATPSPEYKIPKYQKEYSLDLNYDHYLKENEERVKRILPELSFYQRFLCTYAAIHLAHKRADTDVVAQWFRDKNASEGTYQWLAPLHFYDRDPTKKPELVATLTPDNELKKYAVRTLMPTTWCYGKARAVSKSASIGHWH